MTVLYVFVVFFFSFFSVFVLNVCWFLGERFLLSFICLLLCSCRCFMFFVYLLLF